MRIKLYSRPKDRSLDAFKEWMHGKNYRIDANAEATKILEPWIDDQQWIEYWKKFWAKVDGASRSQNT